MIGFILKRETGSEQKNGDQVKKNSLTFKIKPFCRFQIRALSIISIIISSLYTHAQVLKSVLYDFDGLDIGQTDLPEGDYNRGDLSYHVAANPLGNSDMLGDRVLQLNLNWSAGNGSFGRGTSRFVEFDAAQDVFNFYFYNPPSNAAGASVEIVFGDDDDNSSDYSVNSDDRWVKDLVIPSNPGWQLISIPLADFTDSNSGGNGIFDMGFGAKGMILMVEFTFNKVTANPATYFLDMICFTDGALPVGASILDLPAPVMQGKCPLGAFKQENIGDQYLIPGEIEGLFPASPVKKIKYVNWFLQFAMDGSTTAHELPGNEVAILLAKGYRPIITWEPLFQGYSRLDPVQPRLNNIINGDYDSYINSFADKIKSYDDTVIIRFAHEFEGDWYPWSITYNGNDPSKYITAFRKVVDLFRARGATKVKWMWCLNAYYAPVENYNWDVLAYPGDSYVDIVATDIYNNHFPVGAPWWQSFRYKAAETYYYLTKYFPQKPLMICELGCRERVSGEDPTSETKAAWMARMDKELQSNFSRAKGLVFFSGIILGNDWRINSSAASLNSVNSNIWSDDYYFEDAGTDVPTYTLIAGGDFALFPNPGNGIFNLQYRAKETSAITLKILNHLGQEIWSDHKGSFTGELKIQIDLSKEVPGIYLLQLQCGKELVTHKILLN